MLECIFPMYIPNTPIVKRIIPPKKRIVTIIAGQPGR
jgi:hypothetical protein